MPQVPFADPECSNVPTLEESPPTASLTVGTASMFSNAQNTRITGGSFVIQTTAGTVLVIIRSFDLPNVVIHPPSLGQELKVLYDSVAPNAILNAGGRADDVRCHPGTRKDVIGLIDKWRVDIQDGVTANRMFWLSGPAGAGKTAIVQTVAESWKSLGIHTANFFFFRTDASRSHPGSLISTLLYQIFDFYPAVRKAIGRVLRLKPRILETKLEEQIDELICTPFRSIKPSFSRPIVFLIDGLDECDSEEKTSQQRILQALDKLVSQQDLPFLALVSSRAEPHISATFKRLTSEALSIFLDDQYSPKTDIRLFVETEFKKIKTLLGSDWPSYSDIGAIVEKSSGQFIYAATIMRFLAHSSAVPSFSLEKVQGIVPPARNSPFSHLDAFYAYILEQADDHDAIRDILSSKLLDDRTITVSRYSTPISRRDLLPRPVVTTQKRLIPFRTVTEHIQYLPPIREFLQFYNPKYTETLFASCISDITTIVQLRDNRLVFSHASLADFLLDRSRSAPFDVDLAAFSAKVFPAMWKHGVMSSAEGNEEQLGFKLLNLIQHTTPAITDALLSVHPSDWDKFNKAAKLGDFLKNISRLYRAHDFQSYKQILKPWVTWEVFRGDRLMPLAGNPYMPTCIRVLAGMDYLDKDDIPFLKRHLFVVWLRKRISRVFKCESSDAVEPDSNF
ncbi:hypothetical protein D9619_011517 [Psilocybe cf. subviscida]|uniref:NACHT domain-containing protein n=1 Tax=Psilocybe cf. subviscida TaxID=2480587 RepID=A0A8H5F9Q1_9AGAR|nr:hypothetical protein D9619_011517 [Psilocybe cf. subviscida]